MRDEVQMGVEAARPEVEPGAGQKVAGWVLRVLGVVILFAGAFFAMVNLMWVMMRWGRSEIENAYMTSPLEWTVAGTIACGVVALGSAMGAFGAAMAGALGRVPGDRFLLWALAAVMRDVASVVGGLLAVAAVIGALTLERPELLVVLVPAAVLVLLAVGAGRLMKRVMAKS